MALAQKLAKKVDAVSCQSCSDAMAMAMGDELTTTSELKEDKLLYLNLRRVDLVGVPVEEEHERLMYESFYYSTQIERAETVLAPVRQMVC
jgi:hypothetical protein